MNRIRAAFRTNEPQADAVFLFTGVAVVSIAYAHAVHQEGVPWWGWVGGILFWPAIAFCVNLLDPIPKD